MEPRFLSLFGLLVLGMVFPQAHAAGSDAAACTHALHQAFASSSSAATLPSSCTRLGPVALGMRKQQVLAALGQPDISRSDAAHPDTLSVVYLYPREFNAQLAQQPRPAAALAYSQLAVRFHDDRVTNLIAVANPDVPLPFDLLGQPAGTHVDRVLQAIGGQPQWNASRDYVQFATMPLGLEVDPDTSALIGVYVAATKQDLDSFALPGLQLSKDTQSGLVNGVR
ncbi:outer membrane protein assembly factor BamE [Xanthomonas indica]|uniref:Outer membrane protein assembly factor BamE n=1 Tax=Xanthomonas indica TaxID=2912242 RepID=A0AAU8I0Z9_9XANT|nr:outer membrane protein assembly factor BamE [Xanthomonas indica]MCI2261768.1 outer membrane protein assembly factor BamE [Xanthomonas indica]